MVSIAMTPMIHFSLFCFFSIVILFCSLIEQPIALTIKLIHRYAPESPFYIANLTDQEIVERLNFQIRTRKQRASSINSIGNENVTLLDIQAIRPSLDFETHFSAFLVKVSLGTFSSIRGSSHKSYYLLLDTATSVTWVQCEDCKKSPNQCYRQIDPPFSNTESSSYKPLPCGNHPLCFPNKCIGDLCSYYDSYDDESYSFGILAKEKFAFPSSSGHEEIVSLVFGCGINNRKTYGEDEDLKMAGIFGMGWGPHSFVTQINSISQGRFSYCLPTNIQAAQGFPAILRFGSDIPLHTTLPKTRLIQYPGDQSYYVNLLDIAINGTRLNIPSSYFQKEGFNVGGCIFDTGTPRTFVSPQAYQMIKQAVKRYIRRYDTSLEIVNHMFGYDLCYKAHKPFRGHVNLPSITFHFEGNADLVVKSEIGFYINSRNVHNKYICLAMVPSDAQKLTVIGSDLQANHFIVYDVFGQKMHFGPRDCS